MHTKDKLAAALREVGLNKMADKAAEGYYHDFLSPLDLPEMALAADLAEVADHPNMPADQRAAVLALRNRHINGEFDANKAESDAWAESEDGKAAFAALSGKAVL